MYYISALGKNSDYVGMLGDLGKEQKFEVTYVEVEEKNDDDQVQCLVQLSTLPVAVSPGLVHRNDNYHDDIFFFCQVCYGVGGDTKAANNDAARNALNYLKMMTKRTVQGKK